MRNLLGRLRRSGSRSLVEQLATLTSVGDGSTLTLDFTTGVLDPRLTFTRLSGGTYVANDGYIYGMDFATSSSLAIGTGSKSVTLTATAGVDRRYLVGQTVWISNGANNMRGPVTAYNASTQVLTIDATGTSGSGSFTSWTVGNASARFDHDPTTLAPRGLLIEGSATNLFTYSENFNDTLWQKVGSTIDTTSVTGPDGVAATTRRVKENSSLEQHGLRRQFTCAANTTYTVSVFIKKGSYDSFVFEFWGGQSFNAKAVYSTIDGNTAPTLTSASGVNPSVTKTSFPQTGWHRYTLTFTNPNATATAADFNVLLKESNAYQGDGLRYMDVYGFSLELGAGASSYIPTGISQGTRGQDLVAITSTNFSSWWTSNNPASFLVDISSTNRPLANHIFRIADSSGSAYGYQSYFNTTTMPMQVRAAMSSTASSDLAIGSNLAANTRTKIGFTVETASLKRFRDGSLAHTLATPTLPPNTLTQMYIGGTSSFGNASADFHIKQFKYWPVTLSDAAMQVFTT